MHRASYRFMPPCGITETLSDVESVRAVHMDAETTYKYYNEMMWPKRFAECVTMENAINMIEKA